MINAGSTASAPPDRDDGRVCAVVVTYNRKALLRECLRALLEQTHPVATVLVTDNVSTDGTLEMLAAEFPADAYPQIEVVTLAANCGGAGGFHEGVKRAAAAGFAWLWLMDDDTIPQPDALEQLFRARERFPRSARPDLLASKVVWTDGSLHPMNISWADQRHPEFRFEAARCGTFPLRTATFVSVLFHRRHVEKYGLPIFDYFVWGDDVEYTGRILREERGVAVPLSVVTHKTPQPHGSTGVSPRFYYHVRNTIWMLSHSRAFSGRQKSKLWLGLAGSLLAHLQASRFSADSFARIGRGFWHGITRRPTR